MKFAFWLVIAGHGLLIWEFGAAGLAVSILHLALLAACARK